MTDRYPGEDIDDETGPAIGPACCQKLSYYDGIKKSRGLYDGFKKSPVYI